MVQKKKTTTTSTAANKKLRKLEKPRYRSFALQKRIRHDKPRTISAWKIWKKSVRHLLDYKKLFAGIVIVYSLLIVVFVRGLGNTTDIPLLKETIEEVFQGGIGQVLIGFTLFGELLNSSAITTDPVASMYQTILVIVISLVIIWALRQTHAGNKVQLKEAFYKATHPLIPFLLVLLVIGLQLVPFIIGATLFSTVAVNDLAVTAAETVLWASLFFLLAVLSLYMICSSIFALYIVTLPDMQPMQALRSARELVRHRRGIVFLKMLFLPFILFIVTALIIVPVIIFAAPIAEWVFLVVSMAALVLTHSYFYSLYRELL